MMLESLRSDILQNVDVKEKEVDRIVQNYEKFLGIGTGQVQLTSSYVILRISEEKVELRTRATPPRGGKHRDIFDDSSALISFLGVGTPDSVYEFLMEAHKTEVDRIEERVNEHRAWARSLKKNVQRAKMLENRIFERGEKIQERGLKTIREQLHRAMERGVTFSQLENEMEQLRVRQVHDS